VMETFEEILDRLLMLARLELADDERRAFAGHLEAMIRFIDQLGELDEDVAAVPMAGGLRLRPDEPAGGLDRAVVLDLAPRKEDGHVRVPPVLPGADAGS